MTKKLKYNTFQLLFLCLFTCNSNNYKEQRKSCIDRVIKTDDSLGQIRNHACKTKSLSNTIKDYTSSLKELEFNDCPEEFHVAFKEHINAWEAMISITDNYPEARGEMHDLFDKIELSADSMVFKRKLKRIWNSWAPIDEFTQLKP